MSSFSLVDGCFNLAIHGNLQFFPDFTVLCGEQLWSQVAHLQDIHVDRQLDDLLGRRRSHAASPHITRFIIWLLEALGLAANHNNSS